MITITLNVEGKVDNSSDQDVVFMLLHTRGSGVERLVLHVHILRRRGNDVVVRPPPWAQRGGGSQCAQRHVTCLPALRSLPFLTPIRTYTHHGFVAMGGRPLCSP